MVAPTSTPHNPPSDWHCIGTCCPTLPWPRLALLVSLLQIQQWCMDGVGPKYTAAEAEDLPAKKRAETNKIVQVLDNALAESGYVAGNRLSVADLVLWAAVKELLPTLHQAEREAVANVTRWFKHVQAVPGLTNTPMVLGSNCVMPLGGH
eukprot:m.86791 g.86791  ORF g.86791 m.86791 type:complete len:150 (+) comp9677_c0_seq3:66-515(+)